jgi:uncharacterized protein (TIGR03083 family)
MRYPFGANGLPAPIWTDPGHFRQNCGMVAASGDTNAEVTRLRVQFADDIAALSPELWDIPSWCAGWRVRDVLGHLVSMAETSRGSMLRAIVLSGFSPDRAVDRLARASGDRPVAELVERLRSAADRHVHMPGVPSELGLGDLLVHSADALRPAGIMPRPPLGDVLLALDTYTKWGRRVVHAVPQSNVTLVAIDADWRTGLGPEVRGQAIDLLLLVSNRRQVVDRLDGPGVAQLWP